MKNQTALGMNKTGKDVHKEMTEELIRDVQSMKLMEVDVEDALAPIRRQFMKESEAVGSIPIPAKLKGAFEMGAKMLKGIRPQGLIDKLGERLAFERTGVRLYDALITKCENSTAPVDVNTLRHYRKEEAEHFMMLKETLEKIGADPTAETPSADVTGVASMGLIKVVGDPRTTPAQALEAILIAELVDNDAWEMLIDLAENAGLDAEVTKFRQAAAQEGEHLAGIRSMVKDLAHKESSLLQ